MACYIYYMIILLLDKMKKVLAAVFISSIVGAIPTLADVDPKIHKLCIEAKDYAGCVRAMKGDTSAETTVNQIQRQGANLTEGNSCPAQHISSGGGYCQRVVCIKRGWYGKGHSEGLGGKGLSCSGGAELTWDNNHQPIRASIDKECPPGVIDVGFQNTCHQARVRGYADFYASGFNRDDNNIVNKVFGAPAIDKLEVGDKIVSINGRKPSEYKQDMFNSSVIDIKIEREGKTMEFTWTTKLQRVDIPKIDKDKL